MNSTKETYNTLLLALPTSDSVQRSFWAEKIVDQNIDLNALIQLLDEEYKVASRFLWLLTDIGMKSPEFLAPHLVYLFEKATKVTHVNAIHSFARYWFISGVPEEHESMAIDYLFEWIYAPTTNVSIKSNALLALHKLVKKYPDLQQEFRMCIEDQCDKNKIGFQKRALRILKDLNS